VRESRNPLGIKGKDRTDAEDIMRDAALLAKTDTSTPVPAQVRVEVTAGAPVADA
jgi:hypothetical protein